MARSPVPPLLLLLAAGCASSPSSRPPELLAPPPSAAAPPATAPTEPPSREATTTKPAARDRHVVVIDPGGDPSAGQGGLADTARAERERRRETAPPIVDVTDKNLAQHATGDLTTAAERPAPITPSGLLEPGGHGEEWWRSEARRRRVQWADAVEEILELELRAAELRNRFYAEADPWVRDSRVKPEWDRTLDQIVEARHDAAIAQLEVDDFLDQGRGASVPAGWLREGLELEPTERPYSELPHREQQVVGEPGDSESLVGEPQVVDEN